MTFQLAKSTHGKRHTYKVLAKCRISTQIIYIKLFWARKIGHLEKNRGQKIRNKEFIFLPQIEKVFNIWLSNC